MSVAARAVRFAVVTTLATAATISIGGLTAPQAVFAAGSESGRSGQSAQNSSVQEARTRLSERQKVVHIAESHLGAHYRFGAEGMKAFDCSGLVFRVYEEAGLVNKISGARRGARAYYHWFKGQGLASRTDPKPGDLVIWHKGKHIGIYIGNGEIVSALNKKYGVRKHGLNFVSGFTAYLHVQLSDKVPGSGGGSGSNGVTAVKANVEHLPVHDGAGKRFDRVAIVDRGTVIKVTDSTRDNYGRNWFRVKLHGGTVGWVASWHVKVVDPN